MCEVLSDKITDAAEGDSVRTLEVRIAGDTVTAYVLPNGRIYHLAIRGERIRSRDSLGVGSTRAQLERHGARFIGYGEGGPFVTLEQECGVTFEFGRTPGFARSLADIPPTSKATFVFVRGC